MSNQQNDTYEEQKREQQLEKLFLTSDGKTNYNFESFLMEKHAEDYGGASQGVLDDDMPDAFDAWVEQLDLEEVIAYRKEYENKTKNR